MDMPADFEWDNAKAASNLAKYGVSFEETLAVFADPACYVIETARPEDGEDRSKAVGMITGRLFTVVFVMRGETCRLISARRSNANEERSYG